MMSNKELQAFAYQASITAGGYAFITWYATGSNFLAGMMALVGIGLSMAATQLPVHLKPIAYTILLAPGFP